MYSTLPQLCFVFVWVIFMFHKIDSAFISTAHAGSHFFRIVLLPFNQDQLKGRSNCQTATANSKTKIMDAMQQLHSLVCYKLSKTSLSLQLTHGYRSSRPRRKTLLIAVGTSRNALVNPPSLKTSFYQY